MQHNPIQAPPKITRFRRGVVGLGGAALLGIMAYAFSWTETPRAQAPADVPVTAQASKPALFLAELKEDYMPPPPSEPQTSAPAEPVEPGTTPGPPPAPPPASRPSAPKAQGGAGASSEKPKLPEKWLFADVKPADPPFKRPKGDTTGSKAVAAEGLITPARWVKPGDARKVLYPDQVIPALTEQNLNSDEPGTMRFMVTQNVVDTQGGQTVLIPQFTRGVSTMEGQIQAFQERVPFKVKSLRFPNGEIVGFDAQIGDRSGANGIDGTVNRHLLPKTAAILGSAILSVGARIPFGSTDNYNPNLAQEFAEDFSRGVNQAGQQLVGQALNRKNTITQQAGYPITIQFTDAISFQHEPTRMRP